MLRACRRLLRPHGRTAFFTIHVAPGLSPADHRRAVAAGPVSVSTRGDHHSLLTAAGFGNIQQVDVTDEFLQTLQRWLDYASEHEAELRRALGNELFEERRTARHDDIASLGEGLLRRSLFVADVSADR